MKKITLTFAALVAAFTMQAQTTVSFETSEGFTAGSTIDSQNSWVVQDPLDPQFTVDNTMASDGTNSLKATATNQQYQDNDGNLVPVGAISPVNVINDSKVEVSFDLYVESPPAGGNASDVRISPQSPSQGQVTAVVKFDYQNNVQVVDNAGGSNAWQQASTYAFDTWYNFKMEFDFTNSEIKYYLDNTLVYTGNVWAATNIENFYIAFDNYENGFYFDNLVVDTTLGTEVQEKVNFKHFVDANAVLNINAENAMNNVAVFNLLGQEVINQNVEAKDAQINLNSLNAGVYLVQVNINGQKESFKVIKK
ncbi:T9SS type A sorting domain-containing protein [uncultured Mesonia sp.]|uniref:T9SS type A sorting domain-containing protein n=1 Tax=uncultured Mesonia sp. TaxID=399731 RepID=UPI00374F7C0D